MNRNNKDIYSGYILEIIRIKLLNAVVSEIPTNSLDEIIKSIADESELYKTIAVKFILTYCWRNDIYNQQLDTIVSKLGDEENKFNYRLSIAVKKNQSGDSNYISSTGMNYENILNEIMSYPDFDVEDYIISALVDYFVQNKNWKLLDTLQGYLTAKVNK